ncbi:MAG: hypothetical protein GY940_46390, partial [bacterium]|nr:hypothetical protein [bacterium]
GWEADRILETLREDFKKLEDQHGLRPDLIFFTGDAAFGHLGDGEGKAIEEQFFEAADLLENIRQSFKKEVPVENVFIVPGNHDVNRTEVLEMLHQGIDQLGNQKHEEVEQKLSEMIRDNNKEWQTFMERLKDYRQFLEEYGYSHLLQDPERLIYGVLKEVNGVNIGIGGLNSAWSCRKDGEKGDLWLAGNYQIQTAGKMVKPADVRIALMHHPFNWFNPAEDSNLKRKMGNHFQFFLHGHEHHDWVEPAKGGL